MADNEYARLACRGCDAPVFPLCNKNGAVRANWSQVCSKRCEKRKLAGIKSQRGCRNCGTDISHYSLHHVHCSARCRADYAQRAKARLRASVRFRAEARRIRCPECAGYFETSDAQKVYCSRRCLKRASEVRCGRLRTREERQAEERRIEEALRMRALKRLARAIASVVRLREAELKVEQQVERRCLRCSATLAGRQGNVKLCGVVCKRKWTRSLLAARAKKRAWRVARKARERAATVEVFDPMEVFERDGWRCQICGVTTPRSQRGSYRDTAPELDHIVALANGGAHATWNCQCACRRCNGLKAAGPPRGQMALFGDTRGVPTSC